MAARGVAVVVTVALSASPSPCTHTWAAAPSNIHTRGRPAKMVCGTSMAATVSGSARRRSSVAWGAPTASSRPATAASMSSCGVQSAQTPPPTCARSCSSAALTAVSMPIVETMVRPRRPATQGRSRASSFDSPSVITSTVRSRPSADSPFMAACSAGSSSVPPRACCLAIHAPAEATVASVTAVGPADQRSS